LACCLGLCILTATNVSAVESPGPKRVLMLFSEGKDLPVNVIAEQAAKAELHGHSPGRIEFYAEHLDASRFPGESYYGCFGNTCGKSTRGNGPIWSWRSWREGSEWRVNCRQRCSRMFRSFSCR